MKIKLMDGYILYTYLSHLLYREKKERKKESKKKKKKERERLVWGYRKNMVFLPSKYIDFSSKSSRWLLNMCPCLQILTEI